MSKAKELAEKAYPEGDTYIFGDASIACQVAYVKGYHQAEKDLELGWEDMAEIVKIANLLEIEWLNGTPWDGIRDWGFYQEVLKRFRERKEK